LKKVNSVAVPATVILMHRQDALVNILKPLFLDEREGVNKEESQETCQHPTKIRAFGLKGDE
jgi:hypothetical protein